MVSPHQPRQLNALDEVFLSVVPLQWPRQMNVCGKVLLPLCRQLWSDLCLLDACAGDCAASQLWP